MGFEEKGQKISTGRWTGVHFNSHTWPLRTVATEIAGGQTALHLTVDLFDVSHRLILSSRRGASRHRNSVQREFPLPVESCMLIFL